MVDNDANHTRIHNNNPKQHSGNKILISAAVISSVLAVVVVVAVTIIAIDETESIHASMSAPLDNNRNNTSNSANNSGKLTPLDILSTGEMINVLDLQNYDTDIVMPTKVSRPGCEAINNCYVPSVYAAAVGEPITWTNKDSAFHSVTSGTYDNPKETFDSGYMNPYDSYTLSFDASGTYQYYCTLHPWMQGTVSVTSDKR